MIRANNRNMHEEQCRRCQSHFVLNWPPDPSQPLWLAENQSFFGEIASFFLLKAYSSRDFVPLSTYGWRGATFNNLGSAMSDILERPDSLIVARSHQDFLEKIDHENFNNPSVCQRCRRIVMTKIGSNRFESLLRHLRNALAHGNVGAYFIDDMEFLWFEDKYRNQPNMRAVLLRSQLLEIKNLIVAGP